MNLSPKRGSKSSHFSTGGCSASSLGPFSQTPYIQDKVGWALGYRLPTLGLAISVVVFLLGTKFYRHKLPNGSPFSRIAHVLVAAIRKWRMAVPDDRKELHELRLEEYTKVGKFRIDHFPSLRFLDKAAVKSGPTLPWMLCPVTQVEETNCTKQMVKMIPILVATFVPSMMLAQGKTLFVKQGTTLDRSIGPNFEITPACLSAFITIFMLISLMVYDRFFLPWIWHYTKTPRGITMLQRLGFGLVLHILIMITAWLAERKRLSVVREHKLFGQRDTLPLTIFVLLPQFALLGIADSFVETAKIELFYDQAPEGMKSLGTSYFTTSLGIGSFLSSFLLSTVSKITKQHGRGWILDNLNVFHFDYYYLFLAALSTLNLLFFLLVAKYFVYNADATESKGDFAMETSPSMPSAQMSTEASDA